MKIKINSKKGLKTNLKVSVDKKIIDERIRARLIEIGKVHKIKSKNSYIACKNTKCINKSSTTFLICDSCEKITEIEEETISKHFSAICNQLSSKYSNHSLEIFGTCVSCNKDN